MQNSDPGRTGGRLDIHFMSRDVYVSVRAAVRGRCGSMGQMEQPSIILGRSLRRTRCGVAFPFSLVYCFLV